MNFFLGYISLQIHSWNHDVHLFILQIRSGSWGLALQVDFPQRSSESPDLCTQSSVALKIHPSLQIQGSNQPCSCAQKQNKMSCCSIFINGSVCYTTAASKPLPLFPHPGFPCKIMIVLLSLCLHIISWKKFEAIPTKSFRPTNVMWIPYHWWHSHVEWIISNSYSTCPFEHYIIHLFVIFKNSIVQVTFNILLKLL